MIFDYSYGSYTPVPGYVGLGNAWTFNGTIIAAANVLTGTWSNVLTLKSNQPVLELQSNQPRLIAVSRQERREVR